MNEKIGQDYLEREIKKIFQAEDVSIIATKLQEKEIRKLRELLDFYIKKKKTTELLENSTINEENLDEGIIIPTEKYFDQPEENIIKISTDFKWDYFCKSITFEKEGVLLKLTKHSYDFKYYNKTKGEIKNFNNEIIILKSFTSIFSKGKIF